MAGLTVTYLFCSPLQSDVCHRTQRLINASPFEARNWLRLRWQTITKSLLPVGWRGVGETNEPKVEINCIQPKATASVQTTGQSKAVCSTFNWPFEAIVRSRLRHCNRANVGCVHRRKSASSLFSLCFQKKKETKEQNV